MYIVLPLNAGNILWGKIPCICIWRKEIKVSTRFYKRPQHEEICV